MRHMAIALLMALGIAACAQNAQTAPGQDPITQIANFTVADLQAADADAVAHNDAISHACYPALIKFVTELQGATQGATTTVKGAFSVFQKGRDIRHSAQGGLPDYLKLGCAALVQDETQLLIKLGAIGASAGTLAPIAPMVLP